MLLKQKTKGYVSVPNGIVDIMDPGCEKCDYGTKTDVIIKPGDYRCRYYIGAELDQSDIDKTTEMAKKYGWDVEESIKRKREDIRHKCFVVEIQLKGRAFQLNSPKWEEIGQICVDTGMAGFFWNKPDFNDDEWDEFCDKMDDNVAYLDQDMGFWSKSGHGDGGYGVYAIKENNEIIALKICF